MRTKETDKKIAERVLRNVELINGNPFMTITPADTEDMARRLLARCEADALREKVVEQFVVKHYSSDERPIIKGNGFDGLEVGETREDAEQFIAWVNDHLAAMRSRSEGAPNGWKWVPEIATEKMCYAAKAFYKDDPGARALGPNFDAIWAEMFSAATTPPGGTKDEV